MFNRVVYVLLSYLSSSSSCLVARGSSTNKLQQVMIPIISSYVCRDKQWYGGRFEEMMLCAGYEEGDRDVCQVIVLF